MTFNEKLIVVAVVVVLLPIMLFLFALSSSLTLFSVLIIGEASLHETAASVTFASDVAVTVC